MKVKEKFKEQGLFDTINGIKPLSYMFMMKPRQMDIFFLSKSGNRTLSDNVVDLSVEDIAQVLIDVYSEKWNKLYEMESTDINIDFNYSETITEKVDNTGTNTMEFSSTDTGSVNAYNDEDFVNDTKQDLIQNNNATNSANKNRELKKEILKGTKTDIIEKAKIHLQNNYFNDIIISDINDFMTLSIFEID